MNAPTTPREAAAMVAAVTEYLATLPGVKEDSVEAAKVGARWAAEAPEERILFMLGPALIGASRLCSEAKR